MITDEYEYYRRQSKPDLLKALAVMTEEQKKKGELSNAQMEETYRMLAPMLSDGQRKTLRALIDELK